MKKLLPLFCLAMLLTPAWGFPADSKPQEPIRALLVTGGCCHDYSRQKLILTKGISARAKVVWTVVQQGGTGTNAKIPLYEDPNWADGFDVVVHNECFAAVSDKEWVERILKPHREGLPALLIHCAMHSYRTGDDAWFEFVGVQSPRHGAHYAYTVENQQSDHPIMQGFGRTWLAPKGELYYTIKLFPSARPLAHAKRQPDNEPQTCVWTNQYGKGRVFGTTIGHYNETMSEPQYLDLVTRGLLWSVDRLDEDSFRPASDESNAEIKSLLTVQPVKSGAVSTRCCGEGNLAFGRKASASSEETGKKNFARHAVDGDVRTRWCAANGAPGSSWQVELDKPEHVRSVRIHWEAAGVPYRYKVDASVDGKTWATIADRSKNKKAGQITSDKVDAQNTKFLRVTFLGTKKAQAYWGSFWEFEAYDGELPPLPEGLNNSAKSGLASVSDVQAPPGFQVTMFGTPPEVNYPVCLTAAPTGEVFVGVDLQGSLGKKPDQGKVLRCIDTDGDGKADAINTFATMDHPRGLIYDAGSLWVLHPPFLSVYHDEDGDGTADRHETLITGISTDEVNKRGADHTTNGIRMGIDGWIYIAVGDFGFTRAEGADGTILGRRGGGIVRVRPDGSDMEIYCWGLRNILDVSIDPYMNVFTRDNTNDGGGWDIRVTHILQSAEYGYPSLYKNFSEEIMPTLADYGGGSGCGTMYFHDARWPEAYGNALYTCDWGRSEVYRHNLPASGATFAPHQETFLKLQRPTDIDVDGSGRMYVSSWKNGKFDYSGPNVGYVAQITPIDFLPKPFPNLAKSTDEQLVGQFASPSAAHRLHAQREILRRGSSAARTRLLVDFAAGTDAPLFGRVAAIFTLKQLNGSASTSALLKLAGDPGVREFTLRALTDRKNELRDVPSEPFVAALADPDPRVRAQALISLGRLGRTEVAEQIVPLTQRTDESALPTQQPLWNQPDPGRVLPHLAVRTLASLQASTAVLKALDGSHVDGALWALKYLHNAEAVNGLFQRLSTTRNQTVRREMLTTLIRLYHREGEYTGGWWGTRPDTTGPYYDRKTWSESPRIASAIKTALTEADKTTAEHILAQLTRHKVQIDGLNNLTKAVDEAEPETPIVTPKVDPGNPNQIANLPADRAAARATQAKGDAQRGKALFTQQSCIACHTYANGQNPKGPHLVDIGKRYQRAELVESVLKPSAKIAQGFDTYAFALESGKLVTGFVVSESAEGVTLREANGLSQTIPQDGIEERAKQDISMMPEGLVNNLTPEELADLLAYLESLK
ncbi:MAG: heme-binding domain-containing protein [Planctomycetaceae bacterium]|nr:heme-binding domain-containing protein [Planctomycetaceae bacterium]